MAGTGIRNGGKWDGSVKEPSGSGTFILSLQYTDSETGRKVVQKGTTILVR